MRTHPTLLLAGAAALGLAGLAGLAQAQHASAHVLTVRLPGGGVEQIRYYGDIPPQVTVDPAGAPLLAFAPFAALEQMSARMDAQMAAMMRQAPMATGVFETPLMQTQFGAAPAGSKSYSFVSSFQGGHFCSRSVQATSQGPGQPPKVVTKVSGDCGAGGGSSSPAAHAAPQPSAAHVTQVRSPATPSTKVTI